MRRSKIGTSLDTYFERRSEERNTAANPSAKEVYRKSEVSLRGISVSSLTRRSHDSLYFSRVTVLSRNY